MQRQLISSARAQSALNVDLKHKIYHAPEFAPVVRFRSASAKRTQNPQQTVSRPVSGIQYAYSVLGNRPPSAPSAQQRTSPKAQSKPKLEKQKSFVLTTKTVMESRDLSPVRQNPQHFKQFRAVKPISAVVKREGNLVAEFARQQALLPRKDVAELREMEQNFEALRRHVEFNMHEPEELGGLGSAIQEIGQNINALRRSIGLTEKVVGLTMQKPSAPSGKKRISSPQRVE